MTRYRIFTACLLTGATLGGVSLLMAAQLSRDDKGTAKSEAGPAAAGPARSIICFGYVDVEGRLIQVFPRDFPQPQLVTEVAVKEGQEIKAGDALVKFDEELSQLQIAKAKAVVDRAGREVELYQAKLARAKEVEKGHEYQINAQKSKAQALFDQADVQRIKRDEVIRLKEKNASNSADVEGASKGYDAAAKAYEAERQLYEGLKAADVGVAVKEAEAGVKVAESGLKEALEAVRMAEYGLKAAKVVAPCDGTVVRLEVSKGMTVGAQTKTPLMVILPAQKFLVRAEIEQEYTANLKVGQAATLIDESNPGTNYRGTIGRIASGFLPKRNVGNPFDVQLNDQRVLECVIELAGDNSLRLGQKLRIKIGE